MEKPHESSQAHAFSSFSCFYFGPDLCSAQITDRWAARGRRRRTPRSVARDASAQRQTRASPRSWTNGCNPISKNKRRRHHVLFSKRHESHARLGTTRSRCLADTCRRRPATQASNRTFTRLRSPLTRAHPSRSLHAIASASRRPLTPRRHRRRTRRATLDRRRTPPKRRYRRSTRVQLLPQLHRPRSLQPPGREIRLRQINETLPLRRHRLARTNPPLSKTTASR